MSNQTTTPTPAPTPAEILRVTCDDKLVREARRRIGASNALTKGFQSIGAKSCVVSYEVPVDGITEDDMKLAVRVLRHLEQQKKETANG